MVFPCLFDEIPALRELKEAAHLLAKKEDWPPLYDVRVLNNNKVPSSLDHTIIHTVKEVAINIDIIYMFIYYLKS
jgi:hypothetical protein